MADGPNNAGNSRKHILDQVETSLRKLGTDYIDLYQIHWWDPNTPIEETLRALDGLIHQGKVRYAGCSNFAAWQVCEAHWTARSLGISGLRERSAALLAHAPAARAGATAILLQVRNRDTSILPVGERLSHWEVPQKPASS